jgi:Polyketide cyclase / dehydrase and lipid transport
MFTSSVEVVIARPVDEVFAFVSDARNRPSWDDSVQSEELTSPEPIGVGSTVRTHMRSMGRDYEIDWEIVEHEAPNRQRIESKSGPFSTTLVYDLTGDTRCDLSSLLGNRTADRLAAPDATPDRSYDAAKPGPRVRAAEGSPRRRFVRPGLSCSRGL